MNRQYFRCPVCNGIIFKAEERLQKESGMVFKLEQNPTCKDCGRTFIIRIFPDLSYEIEQY